MRGTIVVAVAGMMGCQTYDFQQVEPMTVAYQVKIENKSGTNLRPNVVALLDRSGSMALPIDQADPACTTGCGPGAPCPAGCATRISELRTAMDGFFSGPARTMARWGLAAFPGTPAEQCSASSAFLEPLPAPSATDDAASLSSWAEGADRIKAQLATITPGGGTPTAASLSFLGATAGLRDAADHRDDFVLLLTDGQPNCNKQNPNHICADTSPARVAACACTSASCDSLTLCSQGCLDESGTVQAVQGLAQSGISTFVIGFGADTNTSDARRVLNQLALAGGYPRTCRLDSDCGAGDSCTSGRCGQAFFHASSSGELTQVLDKVLHQLPGDPCAIVLESSWQNPTVTLLADGEWTAPGPDTWALAGSSVTLQGALCDRARAATPSAPLNIEVRVVERL